MLLLLIFGCSRQLFDALFVNSKPEKRFVMLPREKDYILRWETKQGKGKWAYMILTSLVWGTLLPVLFYAFKLAWHGELTFSNIQNIFWNSRYAMIWGFCALAVFTKSFVFWHLAKHKYSSLKRKQQLELRAERHSDTEEDS